MSNHILSLDKILQSQGFGSRKHCQQLIKTGKVMIENIIIDDIKAKINTDNLIFYVFGEPYQYREKVYIALNKPQGYECSHQPTHYPSIFSFFPQYLSARQIQCVGRLDQDTTGFLLFTDDGQFLHRLTHPKKHVAKYYLVQTLDKLTAPQLLQLQQGVQLHHEKGIFACTEIQLVDENSCYIAIEQGVYHQVKRMFAAVGQQVVSLHRSQIGGLKLLDLPITMGEWCYLEQSEIDKILQSD